MNYNFEQAVDTFRDRVAIPVTATLIYGGVGDALGAGIEDVFNLDCNSWSTTSYFFPRLCADDLSSGIAIGAAVASIPLRKQMNGLVERFFDYTIPDGVSSYDSRPKTEAARGAILTLGVAAAGSTLSAEIEDIVDSQDSKFISSNSNWYCAGGGAAIGLAIATAFLLNRICDPR